MPQKSNETVSIGAWIGLMLLMGLPIINLIVLIVLAAGSSTKKSLKNWAIAQFIIKLIVLVLILVFGGIFYSAIVSILDYNIY